MLFVVCAAVQAAQDGILAPIGDRERATVLPFTPLGPLSNYHRHGATQAPRRIGSQ